MNAAGSPSRVVIHVPHDHGACHREVRRARAVLHEQSHGADPLPHVNDDGVAAATGEGTCVGANALTKF
jgi:hypothetical protein